MVTSLKDLCIAVESVLAKNNIAWRYTSSRDVKNLLLEDGKGTIISIRYSKPEHQNYMHIIKMPEHGGVELLVDDLFVYGEEHIKELINTFIVK